MIVWTRCQCIARDTRIHAIWERWETGESFLNWLLCDLFSGRTLEQCCLEVFITHLINASEGNSAVLLNIVVPIPLSLHLILLCFSSHRDLYTMQCTSQCASDDCAQCSLRCASHDYVWSPYHHASRTLVLLITASNVHFIVRLSSCTSQVAVLRANCTSR